MQGKILTSGFILGVQAEYLAIAEEQFYQSNGNPDLAKNRAVEEMKRLYGVTRMGSTATVMKHPPEMYWPAEAGASDPYGYARDQIVDELVQFVDDEQLRGWFPNMDAREMALPEMRRRAVMDSLIIMSGPKTDDMVRSGRLPGYFVGYIDPNGYIQTTPKGLFVPDIEPVMKAQKRSVDQAQEDRTWLIDDQNALQSDDAGRDRSLGSFLDGIPAGPQKRELPIMDTQPQTMQQELRDQRGQLMDEARNSGLLSSGDM